MGRPCACCGCRCFLLDNGFSREDLVISTFNQLTEASVSATITAEVADGTTINCKGGTKEPSTLAGRLQLAADNTWVTGAADPLRTRFSVVDQSWFDAQRPSVPFPAFPTIGSPSQTLASGSFEAQLDYLASASAAQRYRTFGFYEDQPVLPDGSPITLNVAADVIRESINWPRARFGRWDIGTGFYTDYVTRASGASSWTWQTTPVSSSDPIFGSLIYETTLEASLDTQGASGHIRYPVRAALDFAPAIRQGDTVWVIFQDLENAENTFFAGSATWSRFDQEIDLASCTGLPHDLDGTPQTADVWSKSTNLGGLSDGTQPQGQPNYPVTLDLSDGADPIYIGWAVVFDAKNVLKYNDDHGLSEDATTCRHRYQYIVSYEGGAADRMRAFESQQMFSRFSFWRELASSLLIDRFCVKVQRG
jgi:hypothetical protein